MSSLNRWTGIGRLGKDPEIRSTQSGSRVANFSLACSEVSKDKQGNKREAVEWIPCACWNSLADIAGKYLRKGNQVYVEGKIQNRTWEKDGETKSITEIHVSHLVLIGNSRERQQDSEAAADENFWNKV